MRPKEKILLILVLGVDFDGGADFRRDCVFRGNHRSGACSGDSVFSVWNHRIHRSTDSGRYSPIFLYRDHSFVPQENKRHCPCDIARLQQEVRCSNEIKKDSYCVSG